MPPTSSTTLEAHPRHAARAPFVPFSFTLFIASIAFLGVTATPAGAVTRSCTGTPVDNTATVLCAPPSGPCDGTTVVVGTKLVLTTKCEFDLDGRALVIDRPIVLLGDDPQLDFVDAGDVTITKRGKIRGPRPKGPTGYGGALFIRSAGRIEHRGFIDLSGAIGGDVIFIAATDVHLAHGSTIRSNALGYLEDGERVGSGGTVDISTDEGGGSVIAEGKLELRGAPNDAGGFVEIFSARNVELRGSIKIPGGTFEGELLVVASDDIYVTGRINADSGAGGDGGVVGLEAGVDFEADVVVGGGIEIRSAVINARGGVDDAFGGRGGELTLDASGPITVADDVVIRLDAAASGDGPGGVAYFDSENGFGGDDAIGPLDGDLSVGGVLSARGGSRNGTRGDVIFLAGRTLTSTAAIDVTGPTDGGVAMTAGEDITIQGSIDGLASDRDGNPGAFTARAGQFTGSTSGELMIATDVALRGGAATAVTKPMLIEGCHVVVADGVTIDGRGGVSGGGSDIVLASVAPMQLGAGSRYLGGPAGSVTTRHPPGADPVIGTGVVFDPSRVDDPTAFSLPGCP